MRHTSIEVTNRQIGWVVAIVMVISLGSFSAGYFWGEKKAADRFVARVEQDALADQVYTSICSLYENDLESDARTENGSSEQSNEEVASLGQEQESAAVSEPSESNEVFCAHLVGFGTSKKAKQFVERLAKKGITVHLRERTSKTPRGKRICWYQVVTDPYTDKNALIALVEKVKRDEHLHDVRIVTI